MQLSKTLFTFGLLVLLHCSSIAQVSTEQIKGVDFRNRFLNFTPTRDFDFGEIPWIGTIDNEGALIFSFSPIEYWVEPFRVLRYHQGEIDILMTADSAWMKRISSGLDSNIAKIPTLFRPYGVASETDSTIVVGAGAILRYNKLRRTWSIIRSSIENTGVRSHHYAVMRSSKGDVFVTNTKQYFKTREPLATSGYVDSTRFQILRVVGDTTIVEYQSSVRLFMEFSRMVEDSQGNLYAPGGPFYDTVRFAINDVELSMPSLRKREANGAWSFVPLPERFRTTFWGAFIHDMTIDKDDNLYLLLRRIDTYSNPLLREPSSGVARINLRTGAYDQVIIPSRPEYITPMSIFVHDSTIFVGTGARSGLRDSLGRYLPPCTGLLRFQGMKPPFEWIGPCGGKAPFFFNNHRRGVGLLHLYGDTLVVGESPLMFFPLQRAKTEIFTSVESAHPAVPYRPIQLFPNPASTAINVRLDEDAGSGPWRISIADERGQIVYVDNLVRDANVSIDISALHAGRYTLVTFSGIEYLGSARFVIQR